MNLKKSDGKKIQNLLKKIHFLKTANILNSKGNLIEPRRKFKAERKHPASERNQEFWVEM